MADQDYRPDLKNRALKPFAWTTPKSFSRVRDLDVRTIQLLGDVERRAGKTKERMRAHCTKFEETWTAREAIKLWQKHSQNTARRLTPEGAVRQSLTPERLMQEARRNVRARAVNRLSNIDRIKTKMQNAIARTHQTAIRERAPEIANAFTHSRTIRRRM